jgi:hypothetical protein
MKYFTFFVSMLFTMFCSGQSVLIFIDSLETSKYLFEVKQLDQFIKRFNNEENIFTGNVKTIAEISEERKNALSYQTERKKILLTLFNLKDTSLLSNSTVDFINFVGDDTNHIAISYYDADWFATVNCTMTYKGKNQNITLTLKNEGNYRNGFKWILAGVNADFINIAASRKDTTKFISPMNHELGFMDLHSAFTDSKNIIDYTSKTFYPDNLSVFLFLVKSGEIKYIQVNAIKYHFLQVKNWRFTVEYFNRPDNNAGWLISSLVNCSDSDKMNYKKTVLSLR